MSHSENIIRIKVVHEALEEMANEVVFVGGATVSLYTDRPAEEIRSTEDVDILIEVANYRGYAKIEEKLREKGFVNDMESRVICRYIVQGIIVDIMPTAKEILGFANKWYKEGFSHSMEHNLDDCSIRIFKPEYFIATKLEAFNDRGENDGRSSTDFEDVIYVLNTRTVIWKEMTEASPEIRLWLENEFKNLLDNPYIDEWIGSHLEFAEQRRVSLIMSLMREFVG